MANANETRTSRKRTPKVAPVTPADIDKWCEQIAKNDHELVRRLRDVGRALNANVTDNALVASRLKRHGMSASSAPVYVSNARRIARCADSVKAYNARIDDGMSKNDANEWAGAIERAQKNGAPVPTFAQWDKAKNVSKAKKNDSQSRKRSADTGDGVGEGESGGGNVPNTPTTFADLLVIVEPMFHATAKASGDVVAFWQNAATWAVGEYKVRDAAAKALSAKK